MKLPKNIKDANGKEPHSDYGGWANFLRKQCEVRDEHDGVRFFGAVNCNYILFPDGYLVRNYGYHGKALMSRIREEGCDVVRKAIMADLAEIQKTLERLRVLLP